MTKAIVHKRSTGETAICRPNYRQRLEGETEEQFLSRIAARSLPKDATDIRFVDEALVPTDRAFRNALKPDLTHDMDKCREIHRENLRALRAPKLAALDIDYQRADEAGDAAAKRAIAAKKQALRDITQDARIASAKTPQELAAVIPEILEA